MNKQLTIYYENYKKSEKNLDFYNIILYILDITNLTY